MSCPAVCRYASHREPVETLTAEEKYDWAISLGPENVWEDGEVDSLEVAIQNAVRDFDRSHGLR